MSGARRKTGRGGGSPGDRPKSGTFQLSAPFPGGARRKTRRGDGSPADRPKSYTAVEECEDYSRSRSVVRKTRSFLNAQRERSTSAKREQGVNLNLQISPNMEEGVHLRSRTPSPKVIEPQFLSKSPDTSNKTRISPSLNIPQTSRREDSTPANRPKLATFEERYAAQETRPEMLPKREKERSPRNEREERVHLRSRTPSPKVIEPQFLSKSPDTSNKTRISPSLNIPQTSRREDSTPANKPKLSTFEEQYAAQETRPDMLPKREKERSPRNEQVLNLDGAENASNTERNTLSLAIPSTSEKPKRLLPKTPDVSIEESLLKLDALGEEYKARRTVIQLQMKKRFEKEERARNEKSLILDGPENSLNVEGNIGLRSKTPSPSRNTKPKRMLPPTPVKDETTARPSVNTTLKSSTSEHKTDAAEIPPFVNEPKRKTLSEQKDEVRDPLFLATNPETEGTSTLISKITDSHSDGDKTKTDVMERIRNNLKFFRRISATEPEAETKPGSKSLMEHLRIGERNFHKYCQNVADFAGDVKKVVVPKARDYSDTRTAGPRVSVLPLSPEESISSAATIEFLIPPTTRPRPERVKSPIFKKMKTDAIRKMHGDKEPFIAPIFETMKTDAIRKIRSDKEKEADVSKLSEDLKNTTLSVYSQARSNTPHSGDQSEVPAGAFGGRDLLQIPSGSTMLHSSDEVGVRDGAIRRSPVLELPSVGASPRKRNPLRRQKNVEEDEPPRESIDKLTTRR